MFSSAAQPQLPAGILLVFSMVSSTPFYICFFVLLCFCSVPSFEVPVRLIGGRLAGITLWVNSFDDLLSKSIETFNRVGTLRYHDFVPLQRPIGFFFHLPIDRNDERQFVSSDADLRLFANIHGFQPLLLFRGSTPPDKPTPPSSPGHSKPKSSSSSSRVSVSQDVRDYIYLRDHSRCCFSGEPLVRPKTGGPNQQILHIFPATTNYDSAKAELLQLPLFSRSHDPRNLFLACQDFNTFLDSGAIRVTPNYIIHISDPELMKSPKYAILNEKPLLLPRHSSRDSDGMPIVDSSISPQRLASFLSNFPSSDLFAWHISFIETTVILPKRLQAVKISSSCCPSCSAKSKCKTTKCSCRHAGKLCSQCISKKCENNDDAKEENDDEEAEADDVVEDSAV